MLTILGSQIELKLKGFKIVKDDDNSLESAKESLKCLVESHK